MWEDLFFGSQPSLNISGYTREKPYECKECGNAFNKNLTSLFISELTEERNQMNVKNVGKPSVIQPSMCIRDLTQERNPTNEISVEKFYVLKQPSRHIR